MAKPDICAVRLGEVVTLRITHDQRILLREDLSIEQLRETLTYLAKGMLIMRNTTLVALEQAYGDDETNGDCGCPSCNLIRLRDLLIGPTLQ